VLNDETKYTFGPFTQLLRLFVNNPKLKRDQMEENLGQFERYGD